MAQYVKTLECSWPDSLLLVVDSSLRELRRSTRRTWQQWRLSRLSSQLHTCLLPFPKSFDSVTQN